MLETKSVLSSEKPQQSNQLKPHWFGLVFILKVNQTKPHFFI